MSKQETIQPTTSEIEKLVAAQHASNKLKQEILKEAKTNNKLLTSINSKLDRIITEIANLAEIGNATTQTKTYPTTSQWDKLPWHKYKQGNGSWIFSNTKGAEQLATALRQNGGKISTATADYKFSGEDDKFISKQPK